MSSGDQSSEQRRAELKEQILVLQEELDALQDTREALDSKLPSRGQRTGRTSQSEQSPSNAELIDLNENLDKIVRRRTQALVASEEQLRQRNDELKRLNRARADFVSIAAHEIRTPLTSMVGYLELMAEARFGEIPEAMQRPMESVRRNAQRLHRLVDEMLDVSRIESDRMTIRKTRCRVVDVARAVLMELLPLAESREQKIRCSAEECPDIEADVDKVHQVVSNLVCNSLRYGIPGGNIRILVDKPPADKYPGNWARLRVRDDGPGIRPEDLDAIFEPFSDINPAKHHSSSGPSASGLGLHIARGLVDLHEGIITVESEPNEFTEFTVLLPALA